MCTQVQIDRTKLPGFQLFAEDEHIGKLFKEQNGVHMKSNDKKH